MSKITVILNSEKIEKNYKYFLVFGVLARPYTQISYISDHFLLK